jgi:uncharacterized protein (UPF0333 family)
MGKISNNTNNNKGFTLVEVLLLIVVLILVGGLGYLGYKQVNKKSTASTSSTNAKTAKTAAVDPYAGWNTGTLKYEKLSFKYPSNWTLADDSMPYSSTPEDLRCLKPGWDLITLTSPHGSKVTMGGPKLSCGGGGYAGGQISFAGHESIKFAGSDIFIVYPYDDDGTGNTTTSVTRAFLSEAAMPDSIVGSIIGGVTTKNITSAYEPGKSTNYTYIYNNANNKSYAAMQADPDLALAKKIFESTSY